MKVSSLLYYIDSDRLTSAPFARPFEWTQSQAIGLLDSLYRGYPTGEIVLWAPAATQIDPANDQAPEIIVDGTQRVTVIYSAIRGRAPSFTSGGTAPLCFHVMSEQFAVLDPLKAKTPECISLPDLFAPTSPGLGQVISALQPTLTRDGSFEKIAVRVSRLAAIVDRSLCVQYMPSDASAQDCREVRRLIHDHAN